MLLLHRGNKPEGAKCFQNYSELCGPSRAEEVIVVLADNVSREDAEEVIRSDGEGYPIKSYFGGQSQEIRDAAQTRQTDKGEQVTNHLGKQHGQQQRSNASDIKRLGEPVDAHVVEHCRGERGRFAHMQDQCPQAEASVCGGDHGFYPPMLVAPSEERYVPRSVKVVRIRRSVTGFDTSTATHYTGSRAGDSRPTNSTRGERGVRSLKQAAPICSGVDGRYFLPCSAHGMRIAIWHRTRGHVQSRKSPRWVDLSIIRARGEREIRSFR